MGFFCEAKRAYTFRDDRSEHYCRCYRYCLPDILHCYYDGRMLVVLRESCKENDEQLDSIVMDLSLMEKLKSEKQKERMNKSIKI